LLSPKYIQNFCELSQTLALTLSPLTMPSGNRRPARAKRLVRAYQKAHKSHQQRVTKRRARIRRLLRRYAVCRRQRLSLSSLSSFSELSSLGNTSSGSESSSDWDDILGEGWRGENLLPSQASDDDIWMSNADDNDLMPTLHSVGSSDSSSAWSHWDGGGSDSDIFGDDELGGSDEDTGYDLDDSEEVRNPESPPADSVHLDTWARLRKWVFQQLVGMYESRYEVPRDGLPRGPSYLHHVLVALKNARDDHFRQELRINPTTFDAIVTAKEDDAIFMNNSNNSQMPVEEQLAITLYRFGHDGNSSGLQSVANWAAVGKGTVSLVTSRVMTAILQPEFMSDAVRFPTPEEKEEAKKWVEAHSCHAWRNGWCFVDGTLIPLAERPSWYGESYFDRKNRYSLNAQVSIFSPSREPVSLKIVIGGVITQSSNH